ncbi:GDSL esterase/lipase At4g01130-like [Dioscorea cayenensis subsp. rotundata]|uniref:GDSL esterase/lipase At4g01130-like n=1 Tax=Dioscorea cayennensis subsp. rotundata TaxID=55577 RepID=A0AB40BAS4_DIOCR|nr:GDSL esterase/lipase At4g01130-like [Dioscorea cayenensis subsp. rotundata]
MRYLFIALLVLASLAAFTDARCDFPAIFNFGASSSDTGGFAAAFPAQRPPYGMTYFGKPVGRASDGRLPIDFIAQGLGLPFLSPYLKSIGSNFAHGANFASSAATILMPNTSLFVTGTSPFYLTIQLNQMKEFKNRVLELSPQGDYLPPKDIFNKALYIFDIGQNDFTGKLATIGIQGVKQYLPQMALQISAGIEELYNELGGRTFMVFNMAPIGCYPAFLTYLPHNNSDLDMYGCMISYNNEAQNYNKMLKEKLSETRNLLPDATIVYVDTHSIKLDLFQHPKDHGLVYGTKACCGYGGEYNFNKQVFCGNTKVIDGKQITASPCKDPENYVSWDGVHTTDAANKLIALGVLNGSFSEPVFPFIKFCDLKPLG